MPDRASAPRRAGGGFSRRGLDVGRIPLVTTTVDGYYVAFRTTKLGAHDWDVGGRYDGASLVVTLDGSHHETAELVGLATERCEPGATSGYLLLIKLSLYLK